MKRLLSLLALLLLVFANTHLANSQPVAKSKKISIRVDIKEEKRLQAEVDNEHQPWRLEPVDVAHASLITTMKIKVPFKKCKLLSESSTEAVVQCSEIKKYIIKMKQLVHPKGIWTATEIQIDE